VELLDFRDAFMQHDGARLKEAFERLKAGFRPDLILTHHDDDRHQDHRAVSQLTWNTWRDHPVFEYEIFKYDGDLGRPNVYVPLDAALVSRKIDLLRGCFASQAGRHWFDDETFRGLLRLRGAECNSPSRYAEAFTAKIPASAMNSAPSPVPIA
jgi:LmbE family N-acetylglucosaminyl deacetylase